MLQYNSSNLSTSPAEQCSGRQVSMAVVACNCTGDTGLRVTVKLLTVKQQYDSNITVNRVYIDSPSRIENLICINI